MTAVTDARGSHGPPLQAPPARWRESAAAEQSAALPRGSVTVTCSAPLGSGGLGRHVQEIVAALERNGQAAFPICGFEHAPAVAERPFALPVAGLSRLASTVSRLPAPLPVGVRALAFAAGFDGYAARRLPAAEHLVAFNGQALTQLRVARRLGYRSLALVSANSHMRRVVRQHERARRSYPLEGSWTAHLLTRNLREYERAERIYVASEYIRESFVAEGVSDERLERFPLTPHPRFDAGRTRASSDRFEIVYSGSLAVHKGVPLLLDAFRRLAHADLRLRLVGGWGTRGMRRFVEDACAGDARISAGPGDPLARLRAAALCVHPAYEDGFGYAPAEALACGVPVIVSEDTGMKELIDSPRTGLILPTGDRDALAEAIDAAYRGEIFGG
jgi:glycosyltransferase involved in cell wall biosynthesis